MSVPGVDEESAVLGAILTDGSLFPAVSQILQEDYFYREEHRLIWRAMTALSMEGQKPDLVTVKTKLTEKKCLTRAGGTKFLTDLTDQLLDLANIEFYAKSVKSAYIGRRLKQTGRRLANDSISPEKRMEIGFSDLMELNKEAAFGKEVAVNQVTTDILNDVIDGNGSLTGISMGFYGLDTPMNGLKPQDYVVLGAESSGGKSAFALQVAANAAREGNQVLFISPEMSKRQLGTRLLSLESGVAYDKLVKDVSLKEDEEESLLEAKKIISKMDIMIDDSSDQTIGNIKLKVRKHLTTVDLVIVDYLQLLCPEDDDKASVTKVTKGLKAIAKETMIPVLVCSQLRRRYGPEPRRPDGSRLRGSEQIRQDADIILLMWYPIANDYSRIEVFIEKNRNGPRGQAMFEFNEQTTKFTQRDVW